MLLLSLYPHLCIPKSSLGLSLTWSIPRNRTWMNQGWRMRWPIIRNFKRKKFQGKWTIIIQMNNSRDLAPQGRHCRAFWTGEKGNWGEKGREGDQTRRVRDSKLPTKVLLQASLPGQWVRFWPFSQPSHFP